MLKLFHAATWLFAMTLSVRPAYASVTPAPPCDVLYQVCPRRRGEADLVSHAAGGGHRRGRPRPPPPPAHAPPPAPPLPRGAGAPPPPRRRGLPDLSRL